MRYIDGTRAAVGCSRRVTAAGADAYLVLGVGFFNVIRGVFALGLISLLGGGFLAFRGAGKPRTEPGDVAVTSVGENKTRDLR